MLEYCCDCDEETGNAGRQEDSIFIEYRDKEVGPLCYECSKKYPVCEDCGEGVYQIDISSKGTHKNCGGSVVKNIKIF